MPPDTLAPEAPVRSGELVASGLVLAAAAISPNMFVSQAAGYWSMHYLAPRALLPAALAVLLIFALARPMGWRRLRWAVGTALWAGPLATVALEIVRATGYRVFGAMPGSMPELMGVAIMNQWFTGPTLVSDLVGWAGHILGNGISFALIYTVIFGKPRWWCALGYALTIATVFLVSPVVTEMMGIGYFGASMAPAFPLTVYLAHLAFGATLGILVARSRGRFAPLWRALRPPTGGTAPHVASATRVEDT